MQCGDCKKSQIAPLNVIIVVVVGIAAQRGDSKKSQIAPLNVIIVVVIIIIIIEMCLSYGVSCK